MPNTPSIYRYIPNGLVGFKGGDSSFEVKYLLPKYIEEGRKIVAGAILNAVGNDFRLKNPGLVGLALDLPDEGFSTFHFLRVR